MTALIHRQTTYSVNCETTVIRLFGIPIFKNVIIDNDERPRRACGFTAYALEAPTEYHDDDDVENDDDEQYIILPYGEKNK